MVNGQGQRLMSTRLQRANETRKHFREAFTPPIENAMLLRLNEFLPLGDFQEGNTFIYRCSSSSQIVCELLLGSTAPLCDVDRDRNSCSPQLPRDPCDFRPRKSVGQPIDRINKVRALLVYHKLLEIEGHFTPAKRRSWFTEDTRLPGLTVQ